MVIHKQSPSCIKYGCPLHFPSQHKMREWPINFRLDLGVVERLCEHNVGHPDPDSLNFIERMHNKEIRTISGIHGCDGCCTEE